ncbi:hypothetical protein F5879DRAFT_218297 [Lentinula edodes]|uniref:F-box domain-containing protein n=1 Tax=Lentinula edodes TaxID=5353 RepID=A0A1Q3E7K0_LENED|nr:hypothetical protein F5879DRAFT_218297 [Lentinula edodes]GAW03146.1 hypothetical protein LENED_004842 [Lentinula edodes]
MGLILAYENNILLERWSRLLCNAPMDIARTILEFAAHLDKTTARSIALVSKDANAWVTPILYQTVVLLTDTHIKLVESGLPSFKHTTTLILSTSSIPDPCLLKQSCPTLRQLHIQKDIAWEISQKYLIGVLPACLHELVVNSFALPVYAFMPLYSVLTHLAFVHDIPRHFPENPAELFPNLTHFACPYFVVSGRSLIPVHETSAMLALELAYALDKVLRIPSLRIAVVLVKDFSQNVTDSLATLSDDERETHMHALLKDVPQKDAPKVVLIARKGSMLYNDGREPAEAWDTTGGISYWAEAEAALGSKKK